MKKPIFAQQKIQHDKDIKCLSFNCQGQIVIEYKPKANNDTFKDRLDKMTK